MVYKETLLEKAERRLRRYAIPDLINYIVVAMAAVFVFDTFFSPILGFNLSYYLMFSWPLILRGQIWRLVTFIIVPPAARLLTAILSLYFYWMVGNALANRWGTFRFEVFYLTGMLISVLVGIAGAYVIPGGMAMAQYLPTVTNDYLNMSMFLALALIFPDMELVLFFILPVKMKWLALIDLVLLVLSALRTGPLGWLMLVAATTNVALFFWRNAVQLVQDAIRRYKWRQNWRR